jgi:hypothetical protein
MEWRFYAQAGSVEESKFFLFLVVVPVRCIHSISPRFYFRRQTFCFLPLAAIFSLAFLYTNNEQTEKEYMETISFTIASKKNQIPRSKLNKGCERPLQGELQVPEKRDRGRLQKMERSPVLMDWYNQHSKNGYTPKSNLHV